MITLSGDVLSSSQITHEAFEIGKNLPLALGIILRVKPADSLENLSSMEKTNNLGYRHECSVLVSFDWGDPTTYLDSVVIPPCGDSGLDNYAECLPRGCTSMAEGKIFNTQYKELSLSQLDGEWCVVGFVGGRIEYPFLLSWWPHKLNNWDPATSGNVLGRKNSSENSAGEKSLEQVNVAKNKMRFFRRKNGTFFLLNTDGSVYLDTTEAARKVEVKDGKPEYYQFGYGGHVQFNIKKSAQWEVNWNDKESKGPRIGAGSNDVPPVHDPSLPHDDQPVTGIPKTRETKRSYFRTKEYSQYWKTSKYNQFCENTETEENGEKGEYEVYAEDKVKIFVKPKNGQETLIEIEDDTIKLKTKGGAEVLLQDGKVFVGPSINLGVTNGMEASQAVVKGNQMKADMDAFFSGLTTYIGAIKTIADPSGAATSTFSSVINATKLAMSSWLSDKAKTE